MNQNYSKDQTAYYQKLQTEIQAEPEQIFEYLGTTEGISQWFPELSFTEKNSETKLIFTLAEDDLIEMDILIYDKPTRIKFAWDIGEVEMTLKKEGTYTVLTLTEKMPFEFTTISQDFTGWYFQVKNIKHLIEEGETQPFDKDQFNIKEEKLKEQLSSL